MKKKRGIGKNISIHHLKKSEGKGGALELSIGTIVILVLAMSMLILGLVLVRTIFTGAKYNVETMNDKVRDQINALFVEDQEGFLYLAENKANIDQGKSFGVAFGIQNLGKNQKFKWQVEVADDNVRKKCGVTDRQAEEWMTTGSSGDITLASGDKYIDRVLFNIPKNSVSDISTCVIRYRIVIKQEDGSPYVTLPFDVDVS
ncbi:MAG: hypothetical protein AABX16_04345 [Nanoarchaeota archaeon]